MERQLQTQINEFQKEKQKLLTGASNSRQQLEQRWSKVCEQRIANRQAQKRLHQDAGNQLGTRQVIIVGPVGSNELREGRSQQNIEDLAAELLAEARRLAEERHITYLRTYLSEGSTAARLINRESTTSGRLQAFKVLYVSQASATVREGSVKAQAAFDFTLPVDIEALMTGNARVEAHPIEAGLYTFPNQDVSYYLTGDKLVAARRHEIPYYLATKAALEADRKQLGGLTGWKLVEKRADLGKLRMLCNRSVVQKSDYYGCACAWTSTSTNLDERGRRLIGPLSLWTLRPADPERTEVRAIGADGVCGAVLVSRSSQKDLFDPCKPFDTTVPAGAGAR